MDRHDWFKILTKGYKPPRINVKKRSNGYINTLSEKEEKENVDSGQIENQEDSEMINDVSDNTSKSKSSEKAKSKEKLAEIMKEQINHTRNVHNIRVFGTDIPPPILSFSELKTDYNVGDSIVKNLLLENYERPTPIQMQAWPLLLKRREVLGCAPTGSGKTAAFLLPIIHQLKSPRKKGFRAIIVVPTRELAKQIIRECNRLAEGTGITANFIKKVKEDMSISFFKKFDILVTTPNRLIYLLQFKDDIQKIVEKVQWLIVDESDKLFEDGKNGFRDQLATIFRACSGPNVMRAMFSATLSFDVEDWCKLNLNDLSIVTVGAKNTCPDVEQTLSFCGSSIGKMLEIKNILNRGYEIPCLIFVQTKERAKELYEEILLTNRPVRCIHSDMTQARRDEIVKQFRERRVWILICTELMGRGIDFKGVNLVINYDFPPSIVSYIHRVGRTGRAGKKGKSITFWTMEDRPLLRSVAQVMKDSGSEVPDWILNMKTSSRNERRKFEKRMPERGNIYEGMKDKREIDAKRKSEHGNKEEASKGKKAKKENKEEASKGKKAKKENKIGDMGKKGKKLGQLKKKRCR